MSQGGGRLGVVGAMNRNIPSRQGAKASIDLNSQHASICHLERELKAVKEVNCKLKEQLEDTRSALKHLTIEEPHERFDERRVNMLKLQLLQLERQVSVMSEALGSRTATLMEVENGLSWLLEKFRHYIGLDVKGAEVPMLRSDLIAMVETCESSRIKLFKSVENCSKENLARPQMFMNSFLNPRLEKDFTLLDVCLGNNNMDFLNLKQVAQLESKLSTLYKELVKVVESLSSTTLVHQEAVNGHLAKSVQDRSNTLILRACAMANDCANDLLSLSLLYPSAPWPALKKPVITDVTYEDLVRTLPTLPHNKASEVQKCVTAVLKACNHKSYMLSQEVTALREEVRFHQAVYSLQLDYIHQVITALCDGYKSFEQSAHEVIVQPLKKIMNCYLLMKKQSSEESLRELLMTLKQNEEQWKEIIQRLDIVESEKGSGSEAISMFGTEFLTALNKIVAIRQKEREKIASVKKELKITQQHLEEELHALIRDSEGKRCTTQNVQPSTSTRCKQNGLDGIGLLEMEQTKVELEMGNSHINDADNSTICKKPQQIKFSNDVSSSRGASFPSLERQTDEDYTHKVCESQTLQVEECISDLPVKRLHKDSSSSLMQPNQNGHTSNTHSYNLKEPKETYVITQSKTRTYEPNLYVANRTLRLRRSGSLTKLSEPSVKERLKTRDTDKNDFKH